MTNQAEQFAPQAPAAPALSPATHDPRRKRALGAAIL
jgi:hypothetical protein